MATEDSRKLFMAGLPDSITEEVLRALFSETSAQVTELTLPRDRATGRPRGFAFVRLGSQDEADRARQELDGRIVDGKMISVRPFHADPPVGRPEGASPLGLGPPVRRDVGPGAPMGAPGGGMDRPPRPGGMGGGPAAPDRTLYVGNLPYDATQEEIEVLLSTVGSEAAARVYLPLDQDGRKRGFGFVTMGSADAANAALEALKGADLRGRRLIVNIAHPKGDRPPRAEGAGPGGPGGGGGGFGGPPRSFGGPPAGGGGGPPGFGPPAAPRSAKGEGRKRKFDEGPADKGGAAAAKPKREKEERWRDQDDDDW